MPADTKGVPGPYDAFVCYNGEDEEDALRLADRLEAENLLVFNAAREIKAGERFIPRVGEALKNAKTTLVLFGKRGGQGWAAIEIDLALREHLERGMPIIPVLLPGASSDSEVPLLSGFAYVDLRQDADRRWHELVNSIREPASAGTLEAVALPRRARRSPWRRPPTPVTVAIAGAAVLVLVYAGAQTSAWWRARAQQAVVQRLDGYIQNADWDGIEGLASDGAVAVEPLDQRLLARYRGEATARAVKALLTMARQAPDVVCPLLSDIVALRGRRHDPVLTYEEVLVQLDGSSCADRADLRDARANAARLVGAASASVQDFVALRERFAASPPFDCAALERLRAPLGASGPRACRGSATASAVVP